MSEIAKLVEEEYLRVLRNRNDIRDKLVELNLAVSTDTLDTLARTIDGIVYRGTVNASVQEGDTCTLEPGYYAGGTVSGVAGGGNYSKQEKTVTPTKTAQTVVPDKGYYALSQVVVNPIPANYQNVSDVTATAADVRLGKIIVLKDGTVVSGEMPDNDAVNQTLDASNVKYVLTAGYYPGGEISITVEEKSVTPTKGTQTITPTAGKVLSKVTVDPIPAAYQDVTPVTTTADKVLTGSKFVDKQGNVVEGTMVNHGDKYMEPVYPNNMVPIEEGYYGQNSHIYFAVTSDTVITPTKETQVVTGEEQFVWFDKVTVDPIPDKYQDVTNVTATADKVLEGSTFVDAEGNEVAGTMYNWAAHEPGPGDSTDWHDKVGYQVLSPERVSYEVPEGYHTANLTQVSAPYTEKTATPTKQKQTIVAYMADDPSEGQIFLKSVTVEPIPDEYQDITVVTATVADVLSGKNIVGSDGKEAIGTMPNNGAIALTFNPLTQSSVSIPAGYTSGGAVTQTDDLLNALKAI